MSFFFWFQKAGSDRTWHRASADTRAKIISEVKPTFVTVLDASDVPEDGWTREQFLAMKYVGPMYFDWDAEDFQDTINDFTSTLAKFKDQGLNLDCVSIFCTGGRGFHLEIPMGCLIAKPPPGGVQQLPYIYKEIARKYVTDTLDMRVYSGRTGRMWRTAGVKRDNGNYKVQITPDEALNITKESYDQLVSSPRPALAVAPPEFCAALNGDFAEAKKRVDNLVRQQKKAKSEVQALKQFEGDYPPAVKAIMSGENYDPDKGFNQICLQLAITANALGKSEHEFLDACDGLIKVHKGDSSRYNSPRKRKASLREMFWYTNDSDLYSFSVGGIKSICAPDVPTLAITGVAESDDNPYSEDLDSDDQEESQSEKREAVDFTVYQGLKFTKSGIHRKGQDSEVQLSHILFRKVRMLKEPKTGHVSGMLSEVWCRGVNKGVRVVPLDIFKSRSALDAYCAVYGSHFSGTDTQAGIIRTILTEQAEKGNAVEYVVKKVGLDLVQDPEVTDERCRRPIWATPKEVLQVRDEAAEGEQVKYTYAPTWGSSEPIKCDIMSAGEFENSEEAREWFDTLLRSNSPRTLAQVLGWYVSCNHRAFYHETHNQFPILQLYGQAGSGKSNTAKLFSRLYFNKNDPASIAAANSTPLAFKQGFSASASVPLIVEEYKPSEMPSHKHDTLLNYFRLAYNQGETATGGLSDGSADSSWRNLTVLSVSTPLVLICEAQEMQTAIAQRCVAVGFQPVDGTKEFYDKALAGMAHMSRLGKLLVKDSLCETVETRRAAIESAVARVKEGLVDQMHERQIFNLAVLICGLEFLKESLERVMGKVFSERLDGLVTTLLEDRSILQPQVLTEAIKALSDLAVMSRTEDPDSPEAIREGFEYIVKDGHLDLLVRESFIKYHSWCKKKGFTPLYKSADVFMSSMAKAPSCVDYLLAVSPLKKSAAQKVFRFDLERLRRDGCEDFKTKLLGN